jgi:hypothetical protein
MCKRTKCIAAVVAVPAILAAAYSLLWVKTAKYVKEMATDALERQGYIRPEYASVEVDGFPFRIRVTMKQPKFTVNAEYVLKKYLTPYYEARMTKDGKAAFGDWQETITVDGELVAEAGLFSRNVTFIPKGDVYRRSEIDSDVLYTTHKAAEGSSFTVATDGTERKSLLWDAVAADLSKTYPALKSVKEFRVDMGKPSWTLRNASGTGEAGLIAECDAASGRAEDKGADEAHLESYGKGCLVHADGLLAVERHYAKLFPAKVPSNFNRVFAGSQGGKADFSFDLDAKAGEDGAVAYALNAMDYADSRIQKKAKGEASVRHGADGKSASFDGAASVRVTKEWYDDYRKRMTRYLSAYAKNDRDWQEFKGKLPKPAAEWLDARRKENPKRFGSAAAQGFFQLFPKLHELGEIKLETAGQYTRPHGGEASYRIDRFFADAGPYGADLKKAKQDDPGDKEYALTIRNHVPLAQDSVRYAGDVLLAMHRLNPEAGYVSFKAGFADALVPFLESLGAVNGETLRIGVSYAPPADLHIGQKPVGQAVGEATVALLPYMETHDPAAKAKEKAPEKPAATQ